MQVHFLTWTLAALGVLTALIWLYLWLFHHRYWTTRIAPAPAAPQPDTTQPPAGQQPVAAAGSYPPVLVVIPARNEAEVIARTVTDVLQQDYPGAISLVVVNDNSQDATAALAAQAAQTVLAAQTQPPLRSFRVIDGSPLPADWSGKLWAVEQGLRAGLGMADSASADSHAATPATNTADADSAKKSGATNPDAHYIWLTDADISHESQVLRELVTRARADNRALVSRMALLCTDTPAERRTIPAFVYFFQMLYPFAAIGLRKPRIHGAAGGCILLERGRLPQIGGLASLRGALIDDCTLADHVARSGGDLWLELTRSSRSQRGYGGSKGVRDMIARTAYTQLRYNPLRLAGTVLGLFITFWCPLLVLLTSVTGLLWPELFATAATAGATTATATAATIATSATPASVATMQLLGIAAATSALACVVQLGTFVPMLRFYGQSPLRAISLPLIATFYLDATVRSAVRHYRGKTGNWKGRVYQNQ